ncbi:MAG: ribosome small subunit-dependent GTPase A, partial [Cryomorphaceae bacterium]|nr:ribosome small subunit-dependent GTPase A [Cryomorphaceae bacterium]
TTTYAEMFDLDSNIRVIDTPGIRGFGLVDISKFELGDFFPEFFSAKQKCKFNNCLHLDEPDCNVKKKIKEGEIYESRYHTYLDMLKDQNIYRKSDESSDTES